MARQVSWISRHQHLHTFHVYDIVFHVYDIVFHVYDIVVVAVGRMGDMILAWEAYIR